MTTDPTGPTLKFETGAAHLAAQLARILPFATNDYSLTGVLGIQLERRGSQLLATTTDRFRIATVVIQVRDWADGVPDDWKIDLPTSLVKRLVTDWKRHPATITLGVYTTPDEGAGHIVEFRDSAGKVVGDRFKALTMPKNLLSYYLAPEDGNDTPPGNHVQYNATYLMSFAKAAPKGANVRLIFPDDADKPKPVTIVIGHDFIGGLMPIRLTGQERSITDILASPDAEDGSK